MPELSRFYGIVIRMYFDEHPPPHFHAVYAGESASFTVDPIGVYEGRIAPRAIGLVVEWAARHREELLENWERMRRDEAPRRIAPLG